MAGDSADETDINAVISGSLWKFLAATPWPILIDGLSFHETLKPPQNGRLNGAAGSPAAMSCCPCRR